MTGVHVEQRGAYLLIDVVFQVGKLGLDGGPLGLGRIGIAAQAGFPEERKLERARSAEVAVGADTADLADAVIAIEAERRQALAAIGGVDGLVFDGLILQVLVILGTLVGDGADLFRGLRGQIAVGRGVSERDLLAGV